MYGKIRLVTKLFHIRNNNSQYNTMHVSTNQLCLWWFNRSETEIENRGFVISKDGKTTTVSFSVKTANPSGVLVKLPIPEHAGGNVAYLLNGQQRSCTVQRQNGFDRTLCYIPCGEHEVEVLYA